MGCIRAVVPPELHRPVPTQPYPLGRAPAPVGHRLPRNGLCLGPESGSAEPEPSGTHPHRPPGAVRGNDSHFSISEGGERAGTEGMGGQVFDLWEIGENGNVKNGCFVPLFSHFLRFCPIFFHFCPILVPFLSHFCPTLRNHIPPQPFTTHLPCGMPATPISPHPPTPNPHISLHFPPFFSNPPPPPTFPPISPCFPHFPHFSSLQNPGFVSW